MKSRKKATKSKRKQQDEKRVATFLRICEEALRTLMEEYGLARTRVDDPGGYMYYTVIYQNETTALRVYFEWRDIYLSVQICRLVDGQVQKESHAFNKEWTSFEVEDLLTVRAPGFDQSPLLATRSWEDFKGEDAILDDVRQKLEIYAVALREYGGDILRGDFSIFPQLDKLVKQKVKKRMAQNDEISRRSDVEMLPNSIAAYETAIINSPDDAWPHFALGSAYFQSLQFDKAIAEFNKAITLNPNIAEAYANCANAFVALGETELALANCDKALSLNPNDSVMFNLRATIHASRGDLRAALADFDRAIALDPTDSMAYTNRGATYSKLGEVRRAIDDYGSAIDWDPDYANSYTNRAFAYYKLGEYEKGLIDCDKALALRPDHAPTYGNRGLCRAALGDSEGATADFRRALELPCPPEVREEALSGLRALGLMS